MSSVIFPLEDAVCVQSAGVPHVLPECGREAPAARAGDSGRRGRNLRVLPLATGDLFSHAMAGHLGAPRTPLQPPVGPAGHEIEGVQVPHAPLCPLAFTVNTFDEFYIFQIVWAVKRQNINIYIIMNFYISDIIE